MNSEKDDLVDVFEFVWGRFTSRMNGLTDAEWSWCPTTDTRIGLRWRLQHVADLLAETRNWTWLGVTPPASVVDRPVVTAADALAAATDAFGAWRRLLTDDDVDLSAPIGAAAGRYGQGSRRSFVLHVADELIHHTAEAALLRDLYAGARSG